MRRLLPWLGTCAGSGIVLSLSLLLSGTSCDSDGYCIDCFDANSSGDGDGAVNPLIDAAIDDGGGGNTDACVLSGLEQCDGLDNDCDGMVDEGDLTGVDVECGSDVGECSVGTTVCDQGAIVCQGSVAAIFELCNTLDDDCDGSFDENNPEGGIICGSNLGECQSGVQLCTAGVLSCSGEVTGSTETCNGRDDDCDGSFDEGISVSGDCGPTSDMGACTFGMQICIGGEIQCSGAILPLPETCDMTVDLDCDGDPLNGFNLNSDVQNCGGCGTICSEANAFMGCSLGVCEIAACETNFFDLDNQVATGCEFGPCNFVGNEICNGVDDDCDGIIDEGVVAPNICDQDGECSGAVATCNGVAGFGCTYGATVSQDVNGNIISEGDCDELDNDCDGRVDEAFVTKGATCDDGEIGACRDLGVVVCNATDDGVECTAVDDDGVPPAESCNNIDDDCDGAIDEGDPRDWVDVGGGVEMFKYEASRPDATGIGQGFISDAAVCSTPGRLPWTNISHPEAEAACASIGARLCSETEWEDTCVPEDIGSGIQGDDGLLVFEMEDQSLLSDVATNLWFFSTNTPGFSGTSYFFVQDGTATNTTNAANLSGAPRLDYDLTFDRTGIHYLWVRVLADDAGDNSLWWAMDDNDGNISEDFISIDTGDFDNWIWIGVSQDSSRLDFNLTTTGTHTLSFYNREDNLLIDKVIITDDVNFVPEGHGEAEICQWSYQTNCRSYQPDTCNGEDFDGDPGTAGDQDIMLVGGARNACFSEQTSLGQVFDMSGNIKEWAAERSAGVNPLRGGSFNNTEIGISCQFDFLTADDSFFLPNIGFRCCR